MTDEQANKQFLRLQQGVATNAQEVRNATNTYMKYRVKDLSTHPFFDAVGFDNRRLGHEQVSAQLMRLAINEGKAANIGKSELDAMYQVSTSAEVESAILQTVNVLDFLTSVFWINENERNSLLTKGTVITVSMVAWDAMNEYDLTDTESAFRDSFTHFMDLHRQSTQDKHVNNPDLARYSVYIANSSDSKSALEERAKIMRQYMSDYFDMLDKE